MPICKMGKMLSTVGSCVEHNWQPVALPLVCPPAAPSVRKLPRSLLPPSPERVRAASPWRPPPPEDGANHCSCSIWTCWPPRLFLNWNQIDLLQSVHTVAGVERQAPAPAPPGLLLCLWVLLNHSIRCRGGPCRPHIPWASQP